MDAIAENKCPRCSGPHLRIACTKPRQGWEDDFEKDGFFTKPPPKAQTRVQLAGNQLNLPHARILSVVCPLGRCLVDTCSDVSVARRDVLTATHFVQDAVIVEHLGGESTLEEAANLELGSSGAKGPAVLTDVFVVEPHMLPAGVVALLGMTDIRHLGLSLDAVMDRPDCFWDQAIPLSFFGRVLRAFRQCFCPGPSPPGEQPPSRTRQPSFAVRATPERATPATPPSRNQNPTPIQTIEADPSWKAADAEPFPAEFATLLPRRQEEEATLLEESKQRVLEEQRRRTANRVAELFREGLARKQALKTGRGNSLLGKVDPTLAPRHPTGLQPSDYERQSSSASPAWQRKRSKFYAVRKGRSIGIFNSWEECERQVKGVPSEFKNFQTLAEAKECMNCVRYTFMSVRRGPKPTSSFVGGKAIRAKMDIWQDGHADALRTECGLDTMSDVNMAVLELLHEIHDILGDDVNGCAGSTAFTREGTLKVLCEGEIIHLPALVATREQLPHSCDVLLGIPGLDQLGVCIDEHRAKQRQPLICCVGEKTLRQ